LPKASHALVFKSSKSSFQDLEYGALELTDAVEVPRSGKFDYYLIQCLIQCADKNWAKPNPNPRCGQIFEGFVWTKITRFCDFWIRDSTGLSQVLVWAQPDSRFDYRTPLLMGRPDPEQLSSSYGPALGNNAPHEWSGWMFVDSHFLCGAALRRRVMITFGVRRRQSSH
jgi:hypothetical protein